MNSIPSIALGSLLAVGLGVHAQTVSAPLIFVLEADPVTKTLVDRSGRFTPTVTGGSVVADEKLGWCLQFGVGEKTGITLKDDGKFDFAGGLTLDALVWLEDEPAKGATFALKVGSFAWSLANSKLNVAWMVFPSEEVFTDTLRQYKYYPVGGDTINGFMNVPLQRWVRLTVAYDEALGKVTTMIDGMPDRQRYRYRGPERLKSDGKSTLALLQGFTNCRVGRIGLSTGRPHLTPPSLEASVNALPFREKMQLTLDHIDPDLPLPIAVTVVAEKPSGSAETVKTLTLDSHGRIDLLLEAPAWKNTLHTFTVNAAADGHAMLSKSVRVANVKPTGPTLLHPDHTMSKDGRRFFPLMVYHAMPEDFPLLAKVGFNVVTNGFNIGGRANREPGGYDALLAQSLDAAQQNGLYLIAATNSTFNKLHTIPVAKAHPAMLLWYGADEPWGDLTRMQESYNTIKMLEPNLPVLIVQNNYSRLQETAPGCDILATDPYPVPNVSLRAVADATKASIRAVAGHKPVWTVLPQYASKIPTRAELRCMAWLAIVSGTNGLGFYAWDDRTRDPQTGALKGWHTIEHPEQVKDLSAVLKEMHASEVVLLAPKATRQPTAVPANSALHFLLKEDGVKRYLLMANDSRRAEETVLKLPDVADGETPSLLEGGEPRLRVRDGEAAVKLPPLGVAVYELPARTP